MASAVAYLAIAAVAVAYGWLDRRSREAHLEDLRDRIGELQDQLEGEHQRVQRLEEQIDEMHAQGLTVSPGPARSGGEEAEESITLPDPIVDFLQEIPDADGRRDMAAWFRRRIRQEPEIMDDEQRQRELIEEAVTA